ncbi:MAG: TonB-dependent receptor [Bacteroidales bacterium]|nr:TonB-dependent receptor [Bacteroidales bacterium]
MRRIVLLIIAVIATAVSALAQERLISGVVIDGDSKEPAYQATVRLLKTDSSLVTGAISDERGSFQLNAPADGDYIVKITSIGYEAWTKPIKVQLGNNIYMGKIKIDPSDVQIETATVTAYANKMAVKKDTFIYNVDAYRTSEGSVIEELVKKLPGAEVDDEGKITINGKEVKKILVDGKEFMTGDTKTAMKNLPTSIVNRVKAYDQKSDLARITGIEDGNEETVLDFSIKPGMNKGLFANADLGIGTEHRYTWRGMGSYFADKSRIMLFTNANNVGDRGFGGGGGRFRGGNNGLNSSKMVGLNYNFEKKNKLKIDGSVRWNHADGDIFSRQSVENFVSKSGAFSNSINQNYTRSDSWNLQGRLEWQPDSMTNIMFRPTLSYSTNDGSSYGNSASYNIDPYSLDYNDEGIDPLDASIINMMAENDWMVNQRSNSNLSYGANTRLNGTLQINRKLNTDGRNITLSGEGGYTDQENKSLSISDVTLFQIKTAAGNNDSTYYTDRYNLTPSDNWNYSVQAAYSEPLMKRTYLQFSYKFQYKYNKSDRSTYDFSNFDTNPFIGVVQDYREWNRYKERIGTSLDDEQYKDSDLSRFSEYKNYIHDMNVNFRVIRDKYQLNVGALFQPQTTEFVQDYQGKHTDTSRSVFNVTPTFEYRFNPSDLTRLEITYRGSTSQPSMSDLLDITDDSDPLNITMGNPGLKPSFTNNFRLNYNTYIREHMRTLMAFVNMNTTKNSVSNRVEYNELTGGRISRPENINGNWGINSGFMFNTALDTLGVWNVNSFTMYNYNNYVGYLFQDMVSKKNTTKSSTIMERLQASWRKDYVEIALDGSINYTHTNNKLQKQSNLDTKQFTYGGSLNFYTPWGASITTEIHNQSRRGYSDNSMNTDELVWNAQFSQSFLKGKPLTISIQFYDILKNLSSYSRNISAMQRSDVEYNTINSYIILHIIYRLNIFGGKDARQGQFGPGGGRGGFPGGGYPGGGRGGYQGGGRGGFGGGGFGGRP